MKRKRFSSVFILVTLFVAVSDGFFVWTNYQEARSVLHQTLVDKGEQLKNTYFIVLHQVADFMQQTATYIAHDSRVADLFLQGRRAVEQEGGGPGGDVAAQKRQELLSLVSQGWEEMTRIAKGRQLHFHLPPDTSFLRVHRPAKFGDDLTEIRHSIVDANRLLVPTKGFESGRVYAGIRGVVPVFVRDETSGEEIHVGALEAGTSFNLMLEQLKQKLNADFAVLMTQGHAEATMWPVFLKEYVKRHPLVNGHMLEAFTDDEIAHLLEAPGVVGILGKEATVLHEEDHNSFAVTAFPLRDYLGNVDPTRRDIGTILIWYNADAEVEKFNHGLRVNLVIAAVGFILIEIILLLALRIEQRLQYQTRAALTDRLTGIANRRSFDKYLDREVARARREQKPLAILLCDIDFFKQYNDFYGHIMGDQCLRDVAATLERELRRPGDFVARYGGEEFVIVLPDTDCDGARLVGEKVRAAVERLELEHRKSQVASRVTISCGISSRHPDKDDVGEIQLLEIADKSLYQAKKNGRNRVGAC